MTELSNEIILFFVDLTTWLYKIWDIIRIRVLYYCIIYFNLWNYKVFNVRSNGISTFIINSDVSTDVVNSNYVLSAAVYRFLHLAYDTPSLIDMYNIVSLFKCNMLSFSVLYFDMTGKSHLVKLEINVLSVDECNYTIKKYNTNNRTTTLSDTLSTTDRDTIYDVDFDLLSDINKSKDNILPNETVFLELPWKSLFFPDMLSKAKKEGLLIED